MSITNENVRKAKEAIRAIRVARELDTCPECDTRFADSNGICPECGHNTVLEAAQTCQARGHGTKDILFIELAEALRHLQKQNDQLTTCVGKLTECIEALNKKKPQQCQACQGTGQIYRSAYGDYIPCESCSGKGS